MPNSQSKTTGPQLIQSLQRMPQQAAAWLCGMTARSLRDQVDAPRNSDGTYDAQSLVGWMARRSARAELTDDEVERIYCVATLVHEPAYHLLAEVVGMLRSLVRKYGDIAHTTFSVVLLERWSWCVDHFPDTWGHRTEEEVRHDEEEKQTRQLEHELREELRLQLKVAVVCPRCHMLRRGRKWIKADPPSGWVVENEDCPTCNPDAY